MKLYNRSKIFVIFFVTAILFSTCTKTDNPSPNVTLSINPTTPQNVTSDAGTFKLTISSNTTWHVAANQTWLTPTPADSVGNGTIRLKYQSNTADTARSVTVTITGLQASPQTIKLTQAFQKSLVVSPSAIAVVTGGATKSIYITSNIAWTASSDQAWCTLSASSGANNGAITATIAAYTDNVVRTANVTISGTGVASQTVIITQYTASNPPPTAKDGDNLLLGNPSDAISSILTPNNYLLVKPQYVTSFNNSKLTANWTSWFLNKAWFVGGTFGRQASYYPDTAINSTLTANGFIQVTTDFYTGSGFSRGHMCPAADRTMTLADNYATFLMTNMVPQIQIVNAGPWGDLENYCRSLVTGSNDELYIISGPMGKGAVGLNSPNTINVWNGLTIPARVWKIVVVLPVGTNDLSRITQATRVIAVIMPNTQTAILQPWTSYRTSVRAIEDSTGFNFLSNVPVAIQNIIETQVDNVTVK